MEMGTMNVVAELAKFGIKPGVSIRFKYAKGETMSDRVGEIIAIRDAAEVKQKTDETAKMSLCLYILKTAEGIKSFWEAGMYGTELV
jgi:hypothetical protein